jgi:hypothetical protein
MAIKYFQWPYNRSNGHKIYQDFQLQDPSKFTQIGIFGLKTNHLATLVGPSSDLRSRDFYVLHNPKPLAGAELGFWLSLQA